MSGGNTSGSESVVINTLNIEEEKKSFQEKTNQKYDNNNNNNSRNNNRNTFFNNNNISNSVSKFQSFISKTMDNIEKQTKCKDITKTFFTWLILLLVFTYFGYKEYEYWNFETNRTQYSLRQTVDTFPIPFVYIDFYGNCQLNFEIDAPDSNMTSNITWINKTYINHEMTYDVSINELYSMSKKNGVVIYNDFYGYHQALIIPPENAAIQTQSKDHFSIYLFCIDASDTWVAIDHINQFNNKDNLGNILEYYFYSSQNMYDGYDIQVTYEWFSYDNRIETQKSNPDYYVIAIDGAYKAFPYTYLWYDYDYGYYYETIDHGLILEISPEGSGSQTTFITDYLIDWMSPFSDAGGMYSTLSSPISIFLIWIIWKGCCKWKGCAPDAEGDDLLQKQLKGTIIRTVKDTVTDILQNNEKEINTLNNEIQDLKNQIQQMKSQP